MSYENYHKAYPNTMERQKAVQENNQFIIPIRDPNDFMQSLKQNKIVVVKAWASYCQPCVIFGEKLEALAQNIYSNINQPNIIIFMSDNIEKENSIFAKRVNVIPTFFIYYNSQLVRVHTALEYKQFVSDVHELIQECMQTDH